MANFFEGVENLLKHPINEIKWMADETKGVLKPLLKGDVSESWDSFKGSFGRHNDMMEDITVPMFGRNKITENPDAAAGAVIGSIFAAPFIGGAMGGSGGLGGLGSTDFGSGLGGFGTEGAFDGYFKPGSVNKPGLGLNDAPGWKPGANTFDPSSGDFNFIPDTYEGAKAAGMGEKPFDWEAFGKVLGSIKPQNAPTVQHLGGRGGGGFNYDRSLYENPLLTREFNALYSAPLYVPLGGQK